MFQQAVKKATDKPIETGKEGSNDTSIETGFRIEALHIKLLQVPLERPYRASSGICKTRRTVVVEMRCGGVTGYGEAAPFDEPFYSGETVSSILALYRDIYLPRLLGKDFRSLEEFHLELGRGVRDNPIARAGLETAAWDLVSALQKKSLVTLMSHVLRLQGVPDHLRVPRDRVECGVTLGIPDSSTGDRAGSFRKWLRTYVGEGYHRVKIKILPGWDQEPCQIARAELGRDFPLATDSDSSYQLEHHIENFRAMDPFDLLFHEQPLAHDDLLDHALLAREIETPLCLDESLRSFRHARQALDCGAPRIWNLKIQRLGLLEALKIYALATRQPDVQIWVGSLPETGLGFQPSLALAAFPRFKLAAEVGPSTRWYQAGTDPVEVCLHRDGTIDVPRYAGVRERLDQGLYNQRVRDMF